MKTKNKNDVVCPGRIKKPCLEHSELESFFALWQVTIIEGSDKTKQVADLIHNRVWVAFIFSSSSSSSFLRY